jgi:hypothetical protein
MKGYFLDPEIYQPTEEDILVGCQRCRECWYEKRMFTTGMRINGPMYCYQVCEKCKTPNDKIICAGESKTP